MHIPANDNLLPRRAIEKWIGVSCPNLYDLMKHKDLEVRFPRPMKLGDNRVRWPESEVRDWIERQKARRDAAA